MLALVLAAGAATAAAPRPPPAHVVVPKALQEQRSAEEGDPLPLLDDPRLVQALGPIDARQGAWVEYLVRRKGVDAERLRAGIVPPFYPDGRFWLELDVISRDAPPAATRMLVKGDPAKPSDIQRLFVALLGQAPLEIPLDQLPRDEDATAPLPPIVRGGIEQVQTEAGRFSAQRIRAGDVTSWRAKGVPLWGMVRARTREQTLELVRFGTSGAKTLFPAAFRGDDDPALQGKGSESAK